MRLQKAKKSHKKAILTLLKETHLPYEDIDLDSHQFYVVKEGGAVIGCAAVERYDTNVLLRSVALKPDRQRSGIGSGIVHELLNELKGKTVYLLTETAEEFFSKFGFVVIDKNTAPDVIKSTSEFSYVCPDTAVCMRKVN